MEDQFCQLDSDIDSWQGELVTALQGTAYGGSSVKGKGKAHPITGHEVPKGEQMYSSTLSLTLALDGVSGQRHAPAALLPGK